MFNSMTFGLIKLCLSADAHKAFEKCMDHQTVGLINGQQGRQNYKSSAFYSKWCLKHMVWDRIAGAIYERKNPKNDHAVLDST